MKNIFICLVGCLFSVTMLSANDYTEIDTSQFEQVEVRLRKIDRWDRKRDQQPKPVRLLSYRATEIEGESLNWCGYVAGADFKKPKKNRVTHVTGSWIVPTITATEKLETKQFSSIWVGMDGYIPGANTTIQQIGTEHDYWVDGDKRYQQNYAWVAMYPNGAYEVLNFPVDAGDIITGEITFDGKKNFDITINNVTKGKKVTIDKRLTTTKVPNRFTAEWIVEGATDSTTTTAPMLANFGTIQFFDCFMAINNVTGSINDPNWKHQALTMVKAPADVAQKDMIIRAVPSDLDDNNGFTVTWQSN